MNVCDNCKQKIDNDFIRVSIYGSKFKEKYNINSSNKDFCSLECFRNYFDVIIGNITRPYEEIAEETGLRGVEK